MAELRDLLPSGSGVDSGTTINVGASSRNRIILDFSFHYMNEDGYYDGWIPFVVGISPCLAWGFDLQMNTTSDDPQDRERAEELLGDMKPGG